MDHPVEQMEDWLSHQAERVQRNVKIVTPIDTEHDAVYHISTNTNIRKFVPLIGKRQGGSEDRTVPRICVCSTLLGCFIGYAQAEDDFLIIPSDGKSSGYKGGWKIYSFPFDVALEPNNRLVSDASASNELWLTMYSPEAIEYIPATAGKAFYSVVRYIGRSETDVRGEVELFVEIIKENGVPFSKNYYLDKGYWRIEGPVQKNVRDWKDDKGFTVTAIERAEFLAKKNEHAALLNHTELVPAHQYW